MKYLNVLLCALLVSGCSWFGGDDDESQIEPAELVDFDHEISIKRLWSTGIGSSVKGYRASLRPAASETMVFAADHEGQINALDLNSGKRKWKVELDKPVSGGVGYGFGLVMVGTLEGDVHVYNAESGSELWSTKVSSEVLSRPQTNGDIVVLQTIDNKLYALDAQSGEQVWRHDGDAPILTLRGTGSALVTDKIVLVGSDSGKLVALNPESGVLIWEARLALPRGRTELERMVDIDGEPLLVGDVVYAVSYQGRLGALSRGTGRGLWFQDSSSHDAPAYSLEQVFATEADDTVRAFRSGSGQVIWSNDQLFLRQVTGPVKFSDYIAVADAEGYLHVLDRVDGHFVGRKRVDGSGVSTPLLSVGDKLIAQANDGSVSAYIIK